MSDIWEALGLEGPTDDIRAIKKAYAKAVKLARPDEHPEQFQALNKAYKQAQKVARARAKASPLLSDAKPLDLPVVDAVEQTEDKTNTEEMVLTSQSTNVELEQLRTQLQPPTEPETNVEIEVVEAPELTTQEPIQPECQALEAEVIKAPELADESGHETKLKQRQLEEEQQEAIKHAELASMLAEVEQLLGYPEKLNKVEHWRFIERSQFLLDDEFNWDFGQEVFEHILAHNQRHAENPSCQLRDIRVIIYLDRFVDWQGHKLDLAREYGEENCQPYIDALHLHGSKTDPLEGVKGGSEYSNCAADKYRNLEEFVLASRLGRILANILDVAGFICVAIWINIFLPVQLVTNGEAFFYSFIASFLLFLIMESSPLQASPGKLLMGYRVMRQDKSSVPWWLNIWRIICYILSMVAIKITFWINLFIGVRILHDRLSDTMVVDLKKSYANYLKSFEIEL
ncbi:RDD family protein [Neptuniibacter sp. SY11_33]|uniref:RDD family protein n=1 Tax=Neptuniibacter sp. SY11_33 TaxID=3398215 RepID=UPI0039F4FD07